MKKVVIFDFDGVIVDSIGHGLDFHQRYYRGFEPQMYHSISKGNYHDAIKDLELIDGLTEQVKIELYEQEKPNLKCFEGIHSIIKSLSQKYILTINTSSYITSTESILKRDGLHDYFTMIVTADSEKSKVKKFQNLFQHFSVNVNECLFLTDSIGDLIEADRVGVDTVCVLWGHNSRSDFDEYLLPCIVGFAETPNDILQYI